MCVCVWVGAEGGGGGMLRSHPAPHSDREPRSRLGGRSGKGGARRDPGEWP